MSQTRLIETRAQILRVVAVIAVVRLAFALRWATLSNGLGRRPLVALDRRNVPQHPLLFSRKDDKNVGLSDLLL
jgi:hypothetical protein